jgi:hypothetical protein
MTAGEKETGGGGRRGTDEMRETDEKKGTDERRETDGMRETEEKKGTGRMRERGGIRGEKRTGWLPVLPHQTHTNCLPPSRLPCS